jgi:uncharacterized protein YkwD
VTWVLRVAGVLLLACAPAYAPPDGPGSAASRPALGDALQAERLALLAAINADRQAAGARPLAIDTLATMVAQEHAEAMASGGFVSHYGVGGDAPYERYAAAGGTAHVVENVLGQRVGGTLPGSGRAAHFDAGVVHGFLMSSPGHRASILDPHRTHVGLGIAYGSDGRSLLVTEEFLARHAEIVAPRLAWRGSPTLVEGRIARPGVRPLLLVLHREPSIRPWVARAEPPPPGPYSDGAEGEGLLVPPWAIVWRRDGGFEASLPLAHQAAGRYYAVLYVAPSDVVDRALARRRVSSELGWPGAAFVIEVL